MLQGRQMYQARARSLRSAPLTHLRRLALRKRVCVTMRKHVSVSFIWTGLCWMLSVMHANKTLAGQAILAGPVIVEDVITSVSRILWSAAWPSQPALKVLKWWKAGILSHNLSAIPTPTVVNRSQCAAQQSHVRSRSRSHAHSLVVALSSLVRVFQALAGIPATLVGVRMESSHALKWLVNNVHVATVLLVVLQSQ